MAGRESDHGTGCEQQHIIGGAQNPMLAGLILRQIDIFQWAAASAIAVFLSIITLITVAIMLRFFDLRKV